MQHHHNKVITLNLTRSHKFGDRDYSEPASPEDHLPKYFAKSGFEGTDPKKVKKEGGGRGNWGAPGTSELEDVKHNPVRPRRRSNSISFANAPNFKSKFEEIEPEPVFEDHMAEMEEEELSRSNTNEMEHDHEMKLEHQSTTSSNGSVDQDRM